LEGALSRQQLSAEDWPSVLDPEEWACVRKGFAADKPVIGRHTRDDPAKWPEEAEILRQLYPVDGSAHVRILGGASSALKTLNADAPTPWTVLAQDAMAPRDFLKGVDYFVYFHHSQHVEPFGRAIIEAMAAGCVAILPGHFEAVFGAAALYCAPEDAQALVQSLYADRERHVAQARRGEAYVRERFGYETHAARMRALLANQTNC